ncbi:MAG: Hsp70 family protein [Lentisphaeria bacterium]|nr:Hsp70 family protein [Lentisphaeria bacterium]
MSTNFIIGIDLGTTNTTMSVLDMREADPRPQIFEIAQITEAGEWDFKNSLPSFIYLPDTPDYLPGSLDLPWASDRNFNVGSFARKTASLQPGKTISSSKSWLCSESIDRTEKVLPYNRQNPDRQKSPVEAASAILQHLKDAWNLDHQEAEERLENQQIILTVPASFDAIARDLTVMAAQEAGLQVTLLEEPQAAFYNWLERQQENWRNQVEPGDRILVCDIGGGTTDFSMIEVLDYDGDLTLQRIAVGDHILLGGDNMDLTLAYVIAQKLQQEQNIQLDQWQLSGLTHACREAKEVLLENPEAGAQPLTVLGRGSSVIGGTITTELDFNTIQQTLLNGFFPQCAVTDSPANRMQGGLRNFGLNYAQDAAITKHLAAFLVKHCEDGVLPQAILFNGGVSKARLLRNQIISTLNSWIDGGEIQVLEGINPDQAVSLGASWYGHVKNGNAIRIKAGSAQSYFIGIESGLPAIPGFIPPMQALCVIPFGMEEGGEFTIPYDGLGLIVGEQTEFKLFGSSSQLDVQPGSILQSTDGLLSLPSLVGTMSTDNEDLTQGNMIQVTLKSILTEIGTVQVWCQEVGGQRQWKLEYNIREEGE